MNSVDEAMELAEVMIARRVRVVFAESCTAGLVSAMVSMTPGISEYLCGSAVTYRDQTKLDWLGVLHVDLVAHTAVSASVARQMATGVLTETVEATWAAAITGHLGPNSPTGLDGVVYTALALRTENGIVAFPPERHVLSRFERVDRQEEAAALLMRLLRESLDV
jgi:PncC family amidohydrolase